jgi:hypothetical protein
MSGNWKACRAVVVVLSLVLCLWFSPPANAQVVGATMSGTVTDASGSALVGAMVSIQEVSTGVTRDVSADSSGFYSAPNLAPGGYKVTVTATGFSTLVRTGLTLTVGAQQQVNFSMQVGQISQQVQVSGEAPAVELSSSEISGTVNQATVEDLPLNGRSWTDLADLTRGVSSVETTESGCSRGCGRQVEVNGARPTQNNYRVDGVSIMDQYNSGPGTQLGGNLGVDAIQEFSVVTNNYAAEYGRTSGGVINAITRSGTNEIHGTAFMFIRDEDFDARNYFDPTSGNVGGRGIPPFHRNQYGGSVGGPIKKGKMFFFGDYEGIGQVKTITANATVPSADAHSGIITYQVPDPVTGVLTGSPPAGCVVTVAPKCTIPLSAAIAEAITLYRVPNAGLIPSDPNRGIYSFGQNTIQTENFYFGRFDWTLGAKDKADVTYNFDRNPQSSPDILNLEQSANVVDHHLATIEETHVFNSSVVNSARFGFARFASTAGTITAILNPSPALTDLAISLVPGAPGAPLINISGVSSSAGSPGGLGAIGGVGASVGNTTGSFSNFNSFQFYDDVFWTKGTHSFKFGGVVERDQENYINNTQPGGTFKFGSVAAFLDNLPKNVSTAVPGTLSPRSPRVTIYGAYAMDDWRIRPNLTLNLGIRYEMATVVTETQGKLTSLLTPTDSVPHTGNPYFKNPTKLNFEPRVGFAWDPFKDGKSSVRGGFGVFDALPLLYEFTSFGGQGLPFYELASANLSPTLTQGYASGCFPTFATCGAEPPATGAPVGFSTLSGNPATFRAVEVDQSGARNYIMQWNLDIQHQITPSLSMSVGYVGSHGVHQPFRTDGLEQVIPQLISGRLVYPVGAPRFNNNFGNIRAMFWMGESSYNGLVAQVDQKLAHGLQISGAFTWSKSMDTSSSTQEGDGLYNSISSENWLPNLKALNYGPSDFNQTRLLAVSALWQIPNLKTSNAFARYATNGWQLNYIFKAKDGPPFTVTWGTGGDPSGILSNDDWSYTDRLTSGGCSSITNPGNYINYVKTQCFQIPQAPNMAFWTANCVQNSKVPLTMVFPNCFNIRGNAGRNIGNGPGLVGLDFSVFKNNYIPRISELFNAQFRLDMFNVINHPNFAPPGVGTGTAIPVDVFDSSGNPTNPGTLLSTTTSARQIQLALKLIF